MKKIMSLISVVVLLLIMTACTNDEVASQIDDLESKIASLESRTSTEEVNSDLESEIETLKTRITDLKSNSTSNETLIADLKSRIETLEEIYFDGIITVVIDYENDENDRYKSIVYKESDNLSFFELINQKFDLSYETSDYGKFLTSIEGLTPKYGSYLALVKNNEMASVGIDSMEYQDGDVFKFKIEWYDETEQAVDIAINKFIENYASQYVNSESIDYVVASALHQLGQINHYVTVDQVNMLYKNLQSENGTVLFKAIIAVSAANGNPSNVNGNNLISQLLNVEPIGEWGLSAYGSLAIHAYPHGQDISSYNSALLTDLTTVNTPTSTSPDIGGVTLMALSAYDNPSIESLIDAYVTDISTNKQQQTGGVADQWSGENSATTAQVILGLVANGIDPTSETFTKEDGNLITRLLEYQVDDGSFKWKQSDEVSDTGFATPQAFAALVMYQQYKNTFESPVNLYNFK